MGELLRETEGFTLTRCARGVRITAKERGAYPKSGVVPLKEWDGYLRGLDDASCDGACVLDFGIGAWKQAS